MVKRDFVVLSLFNVAERWGGPEDFLEIAFTGRALNQRELLKEMM